MSEGTGKEGTTVSRWRTLSRERMLDCRIFTVDRVRRESQDGEKSGDFYLINSRDWVNVLAITDDMQLVLIRQYRQGTDEISLEIPGGILDEDESPEKAGARELLEETGYVAERVEVIGRVRPNPAMFDNWNYSVLASGARRSGSVNFDEHEEIEVELVPLAKVDELLRNGEINHALVIDALMWYRMRERS
jgi:8-oxo-dGTP pyrophosphatase MutT (NUDIX family)